MMTMHALIHRLIRISVVTALFAGVFALTPQPARAQSTEAIRAIFLFNFAKHVDWPDTAFKDARSPIVIGINDSDAVADALERSVRGKDANGRDISVKRIANAEQGATCHIVYLANKKKSAEFLEGLKGKPVLTVSDQSDFTENGGMIELIEKDNRVGCFVNVTVTDTAGLKLSSKLVAAKN